MTTKPDPSRPRSKDMRLALRTIYALIQRLEAIDARVKKLEKRKKKALEEGP
jgi:hypothetical protein